MNIYWIYDIPNWFLLIVVIAFFVLVSVIGLLVTAPFIKRWMGCKGPASNNLVVGFLSVSGVLYGIMLGLITVNTWDNFSSVKSLLAKEASYLGTLYRTVSYFPEPYNKEMTAQVKEITRYIIEEGWSLQQKGLLPSSEASMSFQKTLYSFEPKKEREKILLSETINLFNKMSESRREGRRDIRSGLPDMLYWVLFIGAGVNIMALWLIIPRKRSLHILISALMGVMIGSLIFLIVAMDCPYLGEFSVKSEPFEIIYNDLMNK